MPNISEVNRELVKAFNINLRFNSIAVTNLTVQNLHGKDHIVISFDKNMDSKQCMKYLNNMKEKIIKRSYRDEKAVGVSYNLKFFPFAFNTKHLPRDDKGRKKFSVEIDEGVVFNLKCYLAKALVRDIKEKMGSEFGVKYAGDRIYDISFDRSSYLYCMLFHDKGLQKDFVDLFSAEIEGYPNPPSDYLEEKGNLVYIKKGIFDDIEFIKDIIAYNASLECRYLQTPSAKNKTVDKLKYTMIDFIDRVADIPVRTITRTSYVNSKEDSVLIPLVQNGKFLGFLSKDDAYDLNRTFGDAVVTRIESHRLKNPYWSSDYVYAIDFADVDISYCVLNKIMESSVINKDHELSIDPELHFRALSPMPNGFLSEAQLESPTRSQSKELEGPPRRGLEEVDMLPLGTRGVPGTSKGFSPSPQLNYPTVSRVVSGPSSSFQSVGAAQNVQAGTSDWGQSMDAWPLQTSSTGFRLPVSFTSTRGPGSSLHQAFSPSSGVGFLPQDPCSPQGTSERWTPSDQKLSWQSQPTSFSGPSSSRGANESMPARTSDWSWLGTQSPLPLIEPRPSCSFRQAPSPVLMVNESSSSGWKIINELPPLNKLNDKEEKLIEALLYTFNLTNYTFGGVYTNFFAKDGKIVSLLHDNVDREKYLQEVKASIKEKARELYDLDEFPFKLNCEEKQGKTVVANISSGALSNLKILFSQQFSEDVNAIDISVVKEAEKREKDEWVDYQLSGGDSLKDACKSCFPDEGAMKKIPIAFEEGAYVLDRSRSTCEVESLYKKKKKQSLRLAEDTSEAGKGEPEGNKDSGYSSGCVTDAKSVSSKAKATTSGHESMDYKNTGKISPKRALELIVGMGELAISTDLDAAKVESPSKRIKQMLSATQAFY